MNNCSENRRKFHRININKRVDLESHDNSFEHCQVKNISLGGMFVKGDFQANKIEQNQIKLQCKGGNERTGFFASARVAWNSDEGVGLEFTSMTNDCYHRLLRTLINNAERPAIIIHEFPKIPPFEIKRD